MSFFPVLLKKCDISDADFKEILRKWLNKVESVIDKCDKNLSIINEQNSDS